MADATPASSLEREVHSCSDFTVLERKETDKAVFVYTSYHGSAESRVPPPLSVPTAPGLDDFGAVTGNLGVSALTSVFVMANSTVGAGVLSLPFAFQATGLIGGLLLCVAVGTTEALTLYVLSKFAERYAVCTYVELVRRALGRKLAALLSAVLVVAMFGACVAYLIILGDNLSSLADAAGLPAWAADRHHIIAVVGGGLLLPMCLPRQLGALARVNQVAVLGFLVGAGLVAYRGMQIALSRPHLMEPVELLTFNYDSLFAIPVVVFGFNCHSTVVSIFHELEANPGLLVPVLPSSPSAFRRFRYAPRPGSRKLVGMLGVIMTSTGLVMLVYVMVGATCYLAFPGHVNSNVLVSFPQDDVMIQIARAAISLVVLGSYPLTHHPARAGFEHLVKPAGSPSSALSASEPSATPAGVPAAVSVVFTLVFVLGSTGVAEVVSDLGIVLHLLGGLCISFIIFFLPGLLLINAAIVKHSTQVLEELEGLQQAEGDDAALPGAATFNLKQPLLQRLHSAKAKGIKKSGIMYAPRLSWLFGTLLLALSVIVAGLALVTVLWVN